MSSGPLKRINSMFNNRRTVSGTHGFWVICERYNLPGHGHVVSGLTYTFSLWVSFMWVRLWKKLHGKTSSVAPNNDMLHFSVVSGFSLQVSFPELLAERLKTEDEFRKPSKGRLSTDAAKINPPHVISRCAILRQAAQSPLSAGRDQRARISHLAPRAVGQRGSSPVCL